MQASRIAILGFGSLVTGITLFSGLTVPGLGSIDAFADDSSMSSLVPGSSSAMSGMSSSNSSSSAGPDCMADYDAVLAAIADADPSSDALDDALGTHDSLLSIIDGLNSEIDTLSTAFDNASTSSEREGYASSLDDKWEELVTALADADSDAATVDAAHDTYESDIDPAVSATDALIACLDS